MLQHKFVEFIPQKIDEGILYVSIEYCTVIHKCICGCGNEVVTPLSPIDWRLTFNGKSVSLYPSIGNWSFACKSHYWIRNNKIEFAGSWTEAEIRLGREKDLERKSEYFKAPDSPKEETIIQKSQKLTIWQKISALFRF